MPLSSFPSEAPSETAVAGPHPFILEGFICRNQRDSLFGTMRGMVSMEPRRRRDGCRPDADVLRRVALLVVLLVALLLASTGPAHASHNGSKCISITGTSSGDHLIGSSGCDDIFGLGGPDRIEGKDGRDDLYGGSGFDRVFGNQLKDYVSGANQDDYLSGGAGADTLEDDSYGGDLDQLCGDGGDDFMNAADGDSQDNIRGGGGSDGATYDFGDSVQLGASC